MSVEPYPIKLYLKNLFKQWQYNSKVNDVQIVEDLGLDVGNIGLSNHLHGMSKHSSRA